MAPQGESLAVCFCVCVGGGGGVGVGGVGWGVGGRGGVPKQARRKGWKIIRSEIILTEPWQCECCVSVCCFECACDCVWMCV